MTLDQVTKQANELQNQLEEQNNCHKRSLNAKDTQIDDLKGELDKLRKEFITFYSSVPLNEYSKLNDESTKIMEKSLMQKFKSEKFIESGMNFYNSRDNSSYNQTIDAKEKEINE